MWLWHIETFDIFWYFLTLFDTFDTFWHFLTLFDTFWHFWHFLTLFDTFWYFVILCYIMWHFVTLCDILKQKCDLIVTNLELKYVVQIEIKDWKLTFFEFDDNQKCDLKNQGNLMLAGKEKRKRWSMPKVEIRGMFNFQGFFTFHS